MEIDDVITDLYKLKEDIFSDKARNFNIGRHRSRIVGSGYRIKKISRWKRGDPFHLIDWQMTLRTWPHEIYKIETLETKEVPIFLVMDSSPSMLVRFKDEDSKFVLALRIMATLGFTGMYFNDPVGIASFGLATELFMLPKYGKRRIINAVEVLLDNANDFYQSLRLGVISDRPTEFLGRPVNEQKQGNTDTSRPNMETASRGINECLAEVLGRVRRQSVVVVISDFLDVLYRGVKLDEDMLSGLVVRHKDNVIFLMLNDEEELSWAGGIGTLMTRNIETGRLKEIKASHATKIREEHTKKQLEFQKYLEDGGIDSLVLSSNSWFDKLADFAANR